MAALSDSTLVIMAGGSGTRFWPKSTSKRPKQFLGFGGKDPLIVQALKRFDGLVEANRRMIVTTESLAHLAREFCPGVEILSEPQGRNTAPCIYWAAREIANKNPKAVMLVMPSDHHMAKPEAYRSTVKMATAWAARTGDLVTLGVKPTRAETGYGYLKLGAQLEVGCNRVDAFVEKPNESRAQEFLQSGQYLWNGGMFIWRVDAILNAFDEHMPEMKRIWNECSGDVARAYPRLTATSIDFGVMEKAKNVVTFTLDCGWDDVGNWTAVEGLADSLGFKRAGGAVSGGELVAVESSGNIVDAPGKCVAILGLNDLIVAEHGGAILVAPKARAQDIKLVVDAIKKQRADLA